jgi:hypothetical protein
MRTLFLLATVASASFAFAAEPDARFKQRDKNNDGKLDPDELPTALFDRLDADKDEFVTEEEAKALSKPRP